MSLSVEDSSSSSLLVSLLLSLKCNLGSLAMKHDVVSKSDGLLLMVMLARAL
jgi:hypothetical protein